MLFMNCTIEMSDNIKNQIFFDGFEFKLTDGSSRRIDFATIESKIHGNIVKFECSDPLYEVFPEMRKIKENLINAQITDIIYDTEDKIEPIRIIKVEIFDTAATYYYAENVTASYLS